MFWGILRRLLPENNSQTTVTVRDLINGGMCLFDLTDPYPIWDENHRAELEKKIIEHYMFRQIGFETAARFKFELNKLMREIMPRYVKLHKTTQYVYNPIENYNMKEGSTDINNGSQSGTSKHSDTPHGSLENLDKYLSSATIDDGKNESKLVHEAHRTGNIGVTTTQQMIEQERKITIDIDMMIIEDLAQLFLGVY